MEDFVETVEIVLLVIAAIAVGLFTVRFFAGIL